MNRPKQGEIIMTNFDPTRGHEQAGYRPALVISNDVFHSASNLTLLCPITNTNRKKAMDVPLEETETTGYILSENVRAVDLSNRGYKSTDESVPKATLLRVIDIVQGAMDVLDGV